MARTGDVTESVGGLIADLRDSGVEFRDRVLGFSPGALETGIYENGWNGREVVAHLAGIEWSLPGLITRTLAGRKADRATPSAKELMTMDGYNAREVLRRRDTSLAELVDEFSRNRDATMAAVASLTPGQLETPAKSLGGASGTVEDVLRRVAIEHLRQHLREVDARV